MEATTAPVGIPAVLHPRAAEFTRAGARALERRIGLLYLGTGVALVAAMGVLGVLMRLDQATVVGISQAWFYRLMTLHGAGMLTGLLVAMMGALWYVLRETVPLRAGRMLAAYALIAAGALAVVVATLPGGFAGGWTFLPPLPFYPAGQWSTWSEAAFLAGMGAVGLGFGVFCVDVVEQATARHGGLAGTLGLRFLLGRDAEPPPPQAVAATVVAIDGLAAASAGMAILAGLLCRTYDAGVAFDALVAKNLVYFFGHTAANLVIYLAAGALYVLVPRYAGRPYATTKVFVAGWMGSFAFILTAYSHHLYMDFVQPEWAQVTSSIVSYAALLPVAVITIYSMTMLVWGSRYRWTLASTLLYVGFAGWAIGGVGAVIDSVIPFNFRLHNTVWVVAHFHTYLMLAVVVWALAFLAHLLEWDSDRTVSARSRAATVGLLLAGGYGLTGTWFLAGALGVPRRYALQPAGTSGYSLAGSVFALVFALGFLLFLIQVAPLARTAWERRGERRGPGPEAAEPARPAERRVPLETGLQLAVGTAVAVVAVAAFTPQVRDAAEAGAGWHHLAHSGQFLLGGALGLVLGSLPAVSRRLGDRSSLGLSAVLAAPAAMMLVMIPRVYESLEAHPAEHALFHAGMAALGLVAGLGATRLGPVAGRLTLALAVAMTVLYAAAVTGGGG
ncbi:MAG TPA: cbb3-type cytochrome c oxidase subunit I [Gaiellaceae bacterium]|nr:cbb3-type cytochrome c oxidase subunit I [Gaiellaceae bacterium]